MTQKERLLLVLMKQVKDRGGASMACDGADRSLAHRLQEYGFAKWHGGAYGSQFWHITDEGVAELEKVDG